MSESLSTLPLCTGEGRRTQRCVTTRLVHQAGDHVLVLGKVIDGKLLDAEAEPLTYRETGAMDGASALFPGDFGDLT